MNSTTRTYRYNYSDCQIMNAIFPDSSSTSLIKCQAKVLSRLMEHIHNTHEMAMSASSSSLHIRSFHGSDQLGKGQASGERTTFKPVIECVRFHFKHVHGHVNLISTMKLLTVLSVTGVFGKRTIDLSIPHSPSQGRYTLLTDSHTSTHCICLRIHDYEVDV